MSGTLADIRRTQEGRYEPSTASLSENVRPLSGLDFLFTRRMSAVRARHRPPRKSTAWPVERPTARHLRTMTFAGPVRSASRCQRRRWPTEPRRDRHGSPPAASASRNPRFDYLLTRVSVKSAAWSVRPRRPNCLLPSSRRRSTPAAEEGLELLSAFSQISDPVVRRTVITMVRALMPRRRRGRDDAGLSVSVRTEGRRQKMAAPSHLSPRSPSPPR